MRETQVQSLAQEDPLEKEMVTHSSILAWRIPWMEKPGRLQSTGSQRVGHDWATSLSLSFIVQKDHVQQLTSLSIWWRWHSDSSAGKESSCNAGDPGLISWVRKICWRKDRLATPVFLGFLGGSAGKESTCNAGDLGSIPRLGKSLGEGNGYPLQYSGLENSMDCIVHGVTKSWTWLNDFHFTSKACPEILKIPNSRSNMVHYLFLYGKTNKQTNKNPKN